jgi:hypothetical protein
MMECGRGLKEEEDLLLQKINDYLYFLIGGEFDKRCPQAEGKDVRLQIDTGSAPPDNIKRLVIQADEQLVERNIRIGINMIE